MKVLILSPESHYLLPNRLKSNLNTPFLLQVGAAGGTGAIMDQ